MALDNWNRNNPYWWKEKADELHKSVFPKIKHLDEQQSYRSAANLRHMRLYGNFELMGLQNYQYARQSSAYNTTNRVTFNIVQSMIDTVVSKITKNRPKPTFLTDGGDFSLQQRGKKLGKFAEGRFQSAKYYQIATQAFMDACIFGTGAIKFFRDGTEIKAERVMIDEIIIDDSEALYGAPRQIHQKKQIHKDMVKAMFPDKHGFIDQLGLGSEYYNSNTQNDMITVVESWHLRSGKDADDGKHTITIENCTLFEEEYTKDYLPFVFIRWGTRPLGFFGQGIAEQLMGIQLEINKILKTIQVSMHLTSIPKVFVEASSKVVTAHLDNKIGGVIKYVGTKPSYESVSAIPQDLFQHLDRLFNRAYEIIGISQLSAQSAKPAGLESGKALREFTDIESERFQAVGMRYEESFMEAAKIFIDMSKDIYEETGEMKVKVKGEGFLETIDWKEIDLKEDQYMMQIYPTSSLSKHPSGRLSDIQELMQAGLIDPKLGLKLLDFPDLKSAMDRENAAIEDIEATIERIIDKGEYSTPEPYQDLQMGIKLMQQSYLLYRNKNVPEDRLELLTRWIEDANELMTRAATPEVSDKELMANEEELMTQEGQLPQELPPEMAGLPPEAAMPEAPMPDAGMPVEPTAVPEVPPTSDLLPV
jgi:hypothetical protein